MTNTGRVPRFWVVLAAAAAAVLPAGTAAVAAEGVGIIKGTVTTTPAKFRRNVVVYIENAPGSFQPPATHAVMDQKGLVFIPHVLPVLAGSTVDFLNSDNVRHNVFSPDGEKFNLGTWPQGEARSYTFSKCGAPPCVYVQLCNVHPEMEAHIVVLGNPYFAVTDAEGRFAIEGVPPGAHVLRAWSEKKLKAPPVPVTVSAGAAVEATLTMGP